MNKLIFTTFLLLILFCQSGFGQVILTPGERDQLIDRMNIVLGNVERDSIQVDGIPSPFVDRVEETAPPPVITESATPQKRVVVSAPKILSDAVALRMISQQFKPLGSLVIGSRGILQLSSGNTIAAGETFNAEIKGHTYTTTIEEVTGNGYTLRLGSATQSNSFLKTHTNQTP